MEAIIKELKAAINEAEAGKAKNAFDFERMNDIWIRSKPYARQEPRVRNLRIRLRELHYSAKAVMNVVDPVLDWVDDLMEVLEDDGNESQFLNTDKLSEGCAKLEEAIAFYTDAKSKVDANKDLFYRNNLAELLKGRKRLHEALNEAGYSISEDGCNVARNWVPSEALFKK